ncbi:MAG: response regulator [Deltaproteobacteria bacterium]|nr:response regulator [Deltaproteobacteria bacterium]MBW1941524.1 response regulator [Deltaproteobacteria bacterium]MBW2207581.1 response regulator [Deltaproteobacteria bacterium]
MGKQTVLIVDDELDMRTYLSTLMETRGYKPIVAQDGLEGLQLARETKPRLIILDVMMPKEGGIQMYRELKTDAELKDIPVIMVSAIAKKTFFHSQNMLGSYMGSTLPEPEAYIEKPPEPEELYELTRNILAPRE